MTERFNVNLYTVVSVRNGIVELTVLYYVFYHHLHWHTYI